MPTETTKTDDENRSFVEPTPKQESKTIVSNPNAWLSLSVGNNTVDIAYGVDEETLEESPG